MQIKKVLIYIIMCLTGGWCLHSVIDLFQSVDLYEIIIGSAVVILPSLIVLLSCSLYLFLKEMGFSKKIGFLGITLSVFILIMIVIHSFHIYIIYY
jgi:hypothetical protein